MRTKILAFVLPVVFLAALQANATEKYSYEYLDKKLSSFEISIENCKGENYFNFIDALSRGITYSAFDRHIPGEEPTITLSEESKLRDKLLKIKNACRSLRKKGNK